MLRFCCKNILNYLHEVIREKVQNGVRKARGYFGLPCTHTLFYNFDFFFSLVVILGLNPGPFALHVFCPSAYCQLLFFGDNVSLYIPSC